MEGAVGIVAVIFLQALAQIARGKGLAGPSDGIYADRLVDGVRSQRHHGAQRLGIRCRVVERDRAAVAVADQHTILDAEPAQQARQDVIGFDLHVAHAGIAGPRARAAVAGAVVDDAAAARGVAKLLREVAPHLDATQSLVQEHQRRALQPVALPGRQPAQAQPAVAEFENFVVKVSRRRCNQNAAS